MLPLPFHWTRQNTFTPYTRAPASVSLCVTGAGRLPFAIRDCSPLCIINNNCRRLEIEAQVMGHTLYAVCAKAADVCRRGIIESFPAKLFVDEPTVRVVPVMDKMSGRR
ncbi:uncharacterized [Tachysurus ichikawai]